MKSADCIQSVYSVWAVQTAYTVDSVWTLQIAYTLSILYELYRLQTLRTLYVDTCISSKERQKPDNQRSYLNKIHLAYMIDHQFILVHYGLP